MSWKSFWQWLKSGEVKPTSEVPLKEDGEIFAGFKITFPWFGDKQKDKKP